MHVDTDVCVVGAGLSGLTVAFRLAQRGRRVVVLEAAARPGGVIGSVRRDGVLYELGPNSGLDTTPLVNELLADAGIAGERIDASATAARRYLLRDGTLQALPTSPRAFLGTPLFSWRAKLALLREPFVGRGPAGVEETVAGFVRRRLGAEFLDYAVEPFVAGIYAGDPERLSLPAAFPRLYELEQKYGGLIRGQILGARERRRRGEQPKPAAASFSFRDGMQSLTDALARGLRVDCGVRVAGLRRDGEGRFTLECEGARGRFELCAAAVVLGVPAFEAAGLVGRLAPEAAAALQSIEYPTVLSVTGCYRRAEVAHPLDGFGFLAPGRESAPILGCLFASSMFDGRADAGTVVLTTFVGGVRGAAQAQRADDEIADTVAQTLQRYLGAGKPSWQAVTRWPQAIPQYTLGHLQRIAVVDGAEAALPGLYFCANWRGGVSIADCIKSAQATVERIARDLPTPAA